MSRGNDRCRAIAAAGPASNASIPATAQLEVLDLLAEARRGIDAFLAGHTTISPSQLIDLGAIVLAAAMSACGCAACRRAPGLPLRGSSQRGS